MSRVAVVGAGAMGGLWAARMSAAGHEVTAIDTSAELVAAIRERGLILVADDRDAIEARIAATTRADEAGTQDIVFVFVKGPHTRVAAQGLAPLLGDETVVITLQNGWGNADVLAETVPHGRLVVGVTYHAATILAPARVSHGGAGPSHVGPYVDGGDMAAAESVAAVMEVSGFETIVSPGVRTAVWKKLIHNAACLPVSALTGLRTAPLVEPGPWRDLIDDLAREAVAVAQALGHDIEEDERIEHIHRVLAAAGMGVPSMLADVTARRATEIETINGAVVRAAREMGLQAHLHEAMVGLVKGLERSWRERADA